MRMTGFTLERVFFLGKAGGKDVQFPETFRVAISWDLENETLEQAEETAIATLYEMAERERKRRYDYLEKWRKEKDQLRKAENKKAAAILDGEMPAAQTAAQGAS
jgi:hypothetical protein